MGVSLGRYCIILCRALEDMENLGGAGVGVHLVYVRVCFYGSSKQPEVRLGTSNETPADPPSG